MPLGANRITLLAFQATVAAEAEVIRKKTGFDVQGNAQISTAQSKFGGSSLVLDGTGDKLEHPYDDRFVLDYDNWTVEYWIRLDAHLGAYTSTVSMWSDATANGATYYFSPNIYNGTNKPGLAYYYTTNGTNRLNGGNIVMGDNTTATGTWEHHAFVKNGNTLYFYQDGTQSSITHNMTGRTIAPFNTTYQPFWIGGLTAAGSGVDGYMDEIRISTTARYTSSFTPSTTPFVNDDDTLLLLHCDGTNGSTFIDDDNGFGRTRIGFAANGNAQIDTTQYKFSGSSAYFDGTNDWIEKGTDTLLDVATSTEFTYEMWIRPASVSGIKVLATNRDGNLPAGTFDISIWSGSFGGTRTASILIEFGSGQYIITGNNVVSANTWHHIACVRDSSNNIKIYVDGTDQTDYTQGTHANAYILNNDLAIGANPLDIYDYQGHIDEFRVSDVCRYTSNFTPATAPFVNDSNTLLLLHMDGTDASTLFLDDNGTGGKNVVTETNGGTNLSTTQKKFGATSAFFDGEFDGLHMFDIGWAGADEVTVECWAYWTNNANSYSYIWCSRQLGNVLPAGETQLIVYSSGQLQFNLGSGQISIQSSTGALSTNTWTHLAVTKSGNTWELWVNGSSVGSASSSQAITVDDIEIGQTFDGGGSTVAYDGYIDEFRVSNTARYTASFTPATAPFTYDSNTLALFHMEGDNNGTVFNNDSGRHKVGFTRGSGAEIVTADKKFGGSSWFVDNNATEYLEIDKASFAQFNTANGDFTVEGWFKPGLPGASGQGNSRFFYFGGAVNGANSFGCAITTGGMIFRGPSQGDLAFNQSNSDWKHYAFVYENGVKSIYYDGSRVATASASINVTDSTDVVIGGKLTDARFNYYGYIDDFRVSNVARYSGTSYTVPTEPFQNDANTLTLLHFDGKNNSTDFVDDNGVTTAGQP